MAKVEMDLAELDLLRQQKTEALAQVKEAEVKYSKLSEEVALVKADKRVIKIIKEKNSSISLNKSELAREINLVLNFYRLNNDYAHSSKQPIRNIVDTIVDTVYDSLNKNKINNIENSSTEFVNFEDVKELLRKELDKQLTDELGQLRTRLNKANTDLAEKESTYDIKLKEVEKRYLIEIKDRDQTIEYLKNDKDLRSLEEKLNEQIKELEEKLKTEQSKKWWQKLIGK